MTSAQPDGRFGALNIEDNNQEKPKGWFLCMWAKSITEGEGTIFERVPLQKMVFG